MEHNRPLLCQIRLIPGEEEPLVRIASSSSPTLPPPAIPGPDLPDLGLDRVHLPWKHLLVLSSTLCVSIWMALEVGTPGRSNSYTHFLPPLPPLIIPVNTCPGRDKGEYAGHQVHQGGSRVALVPARLPQLVQSCSTYFM